MSPHSSLALILFAFIIRPWTSQPPLLQMLSLTADTFPCGLWGLRARKSQDDYWQLGAVHLEHLPSGPQGLLHWRTHTCARHGQTLGRDLDRAHQAPEMSSEVLNDRGIQAERQACIRIILT